MLIVAHNDYDALPNLIRFNQEELHRGQIMVVTGNPFTQLGNGKTVSAAALGCITDTNPRHPFSVEKHQFRLTPALKMFNQFFNDYKDHRIFYQTGVLDEGQLSIPSMEWYTASAQSMVATATLMRKARGLAIIVTPNFNFILKSIRYLVNLWAYPDTEYSAGKITGRLKIFNVSKDLFSDKISTHQLSVYDEIEKRPVWIEDCIVEMPPDDLMNAIEEKDDLNKSEMMKEAFQSSENFDKHADRMGRKTPAQVAEELVNLPEVNLEFKKTGKVSGGMIAYLDKTLNQNKAHQIARIINIHKEKELGTNAG